MTTTPAMPEFIRVLVKVQGGDMHSTEAQFMGDDIGYLVAVPREWQSATLQAQPAAVSDAEIDRICYLATEIRFAKTDDAAQAVIDKIRAILALRPQAVPMTDAWNWLTEANIDAYLEDYEMRGEDEAGRDASYTPTEGDRALLKDFVFGLLTEAQEAAHGITAQAKGGA